MEIGRRPEFINTRKHSEMRKNNKRQQKDKEGQAELFPVSPEVHGTDGIGSVHGRKAELVSRLKSQRTLTGQLMEEIADYRNLTEAYEQVKRNDGSAGVDGMGVEALQSWLVSHIETLRSSLLNGTWEVTAVKKVEIPKPNGGVRLLGIPTVKDRLVQQAIHQVLERHYDPHFSRSSYGFRPGRSAHDALRQSAQYVKEGREWVVDIDLEKFFDKINHDRLMQRLSKGIGDKRVLRLINAYLKAGLMSEGIVEQRTSGTPQGGPLSPLLSNIVLDELDRELEARGHKFCRYADDCNIYVKSEAAGERVLASVTRFIEEKLKLKVNREKSGARHCGKVKFLGYTLLPGGDLRVADKSVERLKEKIREKTKRTRGVKFAIVIKELNQIVTGWSNYFRMSNKWLSTFREIDSWMRRKVRCYRLKQCGRKYTVYKTLRELGLSEKKSWNVALYSQGWWAMSNKQATCEAMNLQWFARNGLRSIYTELTRLKC